MRAHPSPFILRGDKDYDFQRGDRQGDGGKYDTRGGAVVRQKLRLPDRGAIIGIIKEFRRLLFPAYFGDAQLMALPPENYAALLLERIETALTAQVALALPEGQAFAAAALTHEILEQLPAYSRH